MPTQIIEAPPAATTAEAPTLASLTTARAAWLRLNWPTDGGIRDDARLMEDLAVVLNSAPAEAKHPETLVGMAVMSAQTLRAVFGDDQHSLEDARILSALVDAVTHHLNPGRF